MKIIDLVNYIENYPAHETRYGEYTIHVNPSARYFTFGDSCIDEIALLIKVHKKGKRIRHDEFHISSEINDAFLKAESSQIIKDYLESYIQQIVKNLQLQIIEDNMFLHKNRGEING